MNSHEYWLWAAMLLFCIGSKLNSNICKQDVMQPVELYKLAQILEVVQLHYRSVLPQLIRPNHCIMLWEHTLGEFLRSDTTFILDFSFQGGVSFVKPRLFHVLWNTLDAGPSHLNWLRTCNPINLFGEAPTTIKASFVSYWVSFRLFCKALHRYQQTGVSACIPGRWPNHNLLQ